MRIAQVAPPFRSVPPTGYGGIERVVLILIEELVRRCHEVTLFASGDPPTAARPISTVDTALWRQPDVRDPLVDQTGHLPWGSAEAIFAPHDGGWVRGRLPLPGCGGRRHRCGGHTAPGAQLPAAGVTATTGGTPVTMTSAAPAGRLQCEGAGRDDGQAVCIDLGERCAGDPDRVTMERDAGVAVAHIMSAHRWQTQLTRGVLDNSVHGARHGP